MAQTFVTDQTEAASIAANHQLHEVQAMNKIDTPFWTAAFLSFVASVSLWFLVDRLTGIFVGIWVPSILALWCGIRLRLNDSK